MKQCTKCGDIKPLSCFNRKTASKDGFKPHCRDCQKAAGKQYYLANIDKERTRARTKNATHEARARKRDWNHRNSAYFAERQRVRRALMKSNGPVESIDTLTLWYRDEGTCKLCEEKIDIGLRFPDMQSMTVDHIVPLTKQGTHTWDNVQAAHFLCNTRKGNRC